MPSAYTILFILIVLVAAATWIIPAGTYEYNEDGEPVPGTYHEIDHEPQQILLDSLKAPINGMYGIEDETGNISFWNSGELFGAIDVALFIIIIGGFLGVTMKTGAINAGIARVVSAMKGREKWMIPVLMGIFALGGTSYGMAEETLAFYPLIVTVMIAAGYDALTGAAVIMLGAGIGVLGSTVNPFATGIASGFADVSISRRPRAPAHRAHRRSRHRHLLRDALRRAGEGTTRRSRSSSPRRRRTRQHFLSGQQSGEEFGAFTGRHKIVLVLFFLAFVVMIYGVIPWEDLGIAIPTLWWWFPEMTASFLLFAILIGVVGGLSESGPDRLVRRRVARSPRRGAHHRHRPRHHRDHEQREDHRHGAQLGGGRGRRPERRELRPDRCSCSSSRSRS